MADNVRRPLVANTTAKKSAQDLLDMLSADEETAGRDVARDWIEDAHRKLVLKGVLEPHRWKAVAMHLAKLTL